MPENPDTVRVIPPLDLDQALLERLARAATDITLAGDKVYDAMRRAWEVRKEVYAAVDNHPLHQEIEVLMDVIPGYAEVYDAASKVGQLFAEWEKLEPNWSFWTDEAQA